MVYQQHVDGIDRNCLGRCICDLKNHRIFDVRLGRPEAALESYFPS